MVGVLVPTEAKALGTNSSALHFLLVTEIGDVEPFFDGLFGMDVLEIHHGFPSCRGPIPVLDAIDTSSRSPEQLPPAYIGSTFPRLYKN